MEVATVFLETSLDTRLAVSFPASATTVADLKRRVGDEHAAAFPHIGHIAVQAIKVNQRGSLYLLTDSMAVRDAFRGVTGAWHLQLQLDALPRSALHVAHQQMAQPPPQLPHGCNCNHPSAIHSEPVAACHQHDSASRSFAALGCRKRSVCEMLTDQAELGATHTESERAHREKHRAVKRRDTPPAADFGPLSVHKEPCSIAGNMCNAANSKQDAHLAPCVEELNQGDPCSEKEIEEKETWTPKEADSSEQEAMQHKAEEKEPLTAKVCDGERSSNGTDLPSPCAAEPTKEGDSSENEAMTRQVEEKEPLTVNVRDGDGSTQGSDHPPPCAAESTKEGDSSEKEALEHKVEEKETRTTRVCNGERNINGTDLPQSTKERDSYEKEAMPRKVEEKEPSTARVSNGERSSQVTDLPPPCVAKCTKEGDSSEKEAMQHKTEEKGSLTANVCNHESSNKETHLPPPWAAESTKEGDSSEKEAITRQEEKEPLAANVCDRDESSQGTDHPSPCASESTKEGDSYENEAMQCKVEEKVCNSESSSNWTDPSPGDGSMNEADSSENEVMQHEAEEKEPWTDSVCKGGGSSHWNDPIEWTDAEQRAWEMALKKRRRPRTAVRKMPNSRAAKLYGYS